MRLVMLALSSALDLTGREEVADLTKALIASGIDYVGIDVRESSLEDIFVSLLGDEEGEAA